MAAYASDSNPSLEPPARPPVVEGGKGGKMKMERRPATAEQKS